VGIAIYFLTIYGMKKSWISNISDLRLTRKDCFTLALFTLVDSDNPGCRLVQGWVTSTVTGESIQHAWCEMPATGTYEDSSEGPIIVVIDYTQPDEHARIIPAELFYEKTGAHNVKRYTLAEAFSRASAVGHDGPWNDQ